MLLLSWGAAAAPAREHDSFPPQRSDKEARPPRRQWRSSVWPLISLAASPGCRLLQKTHPLRRGIFGCGCQCRASLSPGPWQALQSGVCLQHGAFQPPAAPHCRRAAPWHRGQWGSRQQGSRQHAALLPFPSHLPPRWSLGSLPPRGPPLWAKKRRFAAGDRSCLVCSWQPRRPWSAASSPAAVQPPPGTPAVPAPATRCLQLPGSDLDFSLPLSLC